MTSRRVLIAGCGYLGTALGTRLAASGHRVFGLRREVGDLPAGIEGIAADLTAPETLSSLPDAIDCVFYTAGAGEFEESAYRATYVTGLANLLRALRAHFASPARLLFVSSTAVYAQQDGEWVDEDSPARPRTFAGRTLLEGEAIAFAAGFSATVLRLGGLYGPGRTRLVREVREGRSRRTPQPVHYTNRIHRDDAAAALVHLMQRRRPPALLLGVDHEPADRNAVLEWLAQALGVPPPPLEEAPAHREGRPESNKRCRNARLLASGFRYCYPTVREGYAELLATEAG